MGFDAEILQCPRSGGRLTADARRLVNGGNAWPVHDHAGRGYVDFRIPTDDTVRATQQAVYDTPSSRYLDAFDKRAFMEKFVRRRLHGGAKAKEALFLRAFRELPLDGGSRVLEIGCNDGRYLNVVTALHGCHGVGIDLSQRAIEAALDGGTANDFHAADATALPFRDRSFDAIVSLDVFEHLGHPAFRQVMAESARVLRPGGVLLVYIVSQNDRFTLHETLRQITGGRVGVDEGEGHRFENFIHPDFFREVAAESGFAVERVAAYHGFWTLFAEEYLRNAPPRWAYRWLEWLDRPLTDRELGNGFLARATHG